MSGWDDTGPIPPTTGHDQHHRARSAAASGEPEEILVGDRLMRVRRRRPPRLRIKPWVVVVIAAVLVAAGVVVVVLRDRPQGLPAVAGPVIQASGGFQAKVGDDGTITVALEIRNVTDEEVVVVGARVVPPSGLRSTALSVLEPDERNRNLTLTGDLPPSSVVTLGTSGVNRNTIVVARFTVDCDDLPTAGPTGEQIFVTVRLGADQREEPLAPPVVDGVPWLTATARTACGQPTTSPELPTPLPPLTPEPDES